MAVSKHTVPLEVTASLHGCDLVVGRATGTDVFETFAALRDGVKVELTRLYPGFLHHPDVRDPVRSAMQLFVNARALGSDGEPCPGLFRVQAVDDEAVRDVWVVEGWPSRCVGVGALVHQMKAHDIPLDLVLVADVVVPICEALQAIGGQPQVQPRAVVVDVDGQVGLWCAEQIARPGRPPTAPNLASSLADLMLLLLGGRAGSRLADTAPELEAELGPVVDACRSSDPPSPQDIGDALRARVNDVEMQGPCNMAELLRVLFPRVSG